MLTFRQGTKIAILDGVNRYNFLAGSVVATQTFVEVSQPIKTIHNPNLVDNTYVNELGAANISFTCYVGEGSLESILLKWFGLIQNGEYYNIVPTNTLVDTTFDLYIDSGNTIYKMAKVVGRGMSISISRKEVLMLTIDAMASNIEIVSSIPTVPGSTFSQVSSDFQHGPVSLVGFPRVSEVSLEISRDISYIGAKTIFDIGSIYTQKTPILSSLSISGSITQYKTEDTREYSPSTSINITCGITTEILLTSCNTTDRWDMSTIHKKVTDYKLLPNSVASYIKF